MINKNDTNEGVFIPNYNFVLLYNSEKDRWLAEELKKDEDNIDINKIQELFILNFKLKLVNKSDSFIVFELPDDFFQIYGSYSIASCDNCKGITISNYERKPGNLVPLLSDDANKPSFDYQEAPFVVAGNEMILYFDKYAVGDTFLNYYRKAGEIDMEGYEHFDGTPSTNIDPDIDDFNCIEILDRIVIEITREIENGEGFQFSKDRENQEF